tara:strand:+ start:2025 stop:2252 length:228 start_codon:yes stop_codon:yes gene_type:complete
MIDKQSRHRTTLSDIIYFYKQQIERFTKIGIGNRTEFNTVVTDSLINITLKRLNELQQRRDRLVFQVKGRNNGIK